MAVTFETLWKKYKSMGNMEKVCTNKQDDSNEPFGNYCAINLSECFNQAGVAMHNATGTKCWSHKGTKHILRAEHFAKWLDASPPGGFGKGEKIAPKTFQTDLDGRTGVVFFKDYWRRGNESEEDRSGDHIDLWNKDEITGGGMWHRWAIEFLGLASDLNASREIRFWEVK